MINLCRSSLAENSSSHSAFNLRICFEEIRDFVNEMITSVCENVEDGMILAIWHNLDNVRRSSLHDQYLESY